MLTPEMAKIGKHQTLDPPQKRIPLKMSVLFILDLWRSMKYIVTFFKKRIIGNPCFFLCQSSDPYFYISYL